MVTMTKKKRTVMKCKRGVCTHNARSSMEETYTNKKDVLTTSRLCRVHTHTGIT